MTEAEREAMEAAYRKWHYAGFKKFSVAMGLKVRDSSYFEEEHLPTKEFIAAWEASKKYYLGKTHEEAQRQGRQEVLTFEDWWRITGNLDSQGKDDWRECWDAAQKAVRDKLLPETRAVCADCGADVIDLECSAGCEASPAGEPVRSIRFIC